MIVLNKTVQASLRRVTLRSGFGSGSFMHMLTGGLVNTGYFIRNPTMVSGIAPSGRGLVCVGTDWYEAATSADWPATVPQNDGVMTCVSVCYPSGVGTDVGRAVAGNSLGSADKGWFLAYENRVAASSPNAMRLVVFNGAGTRVDARIGAPILAGRRVVTAFRTSPSGVEMWVNGVGNTVSWSAGAASGSAARALHVGRANHTSTVIPFDGVIESIAFIPRAMNSTWLRFASLDPYGALLNPTTAYLDYVAAAAAVPSITALSAENITATSADYRVTLDYA